MPVNTLSPVTCPRLERQGQQQWRSHPSGLGKGLGSGGQSDFPGASSLPLPHPSGAEACTCVLVSQDGPTAQRLLGGQRQEGVKVQLYWKYASIALTWKLGATWASGLGKADGLKCPGGQVVGDQGKGFEQEGMDPLAWLNSQPRGSLGHYPLPKG